MAAIGTLPVLFGTGIHASRPAASAVGKGGLYACSTHSLIYQTDGSSWSTWLTATGSSPSGSITASGYTQSTAKMLGRSTGSTGAIEEITVGSGLSLSAGSLTATGGGGDMTRLSDTTLGSDTASFDISGISGSYKTLRCVLQGRSNRASNSEDPVRMRFNNDSGSNYDTQYQQWFGGTTGTPEEQLAQTELKNFATTPGATSPSGASCQVVFDIVNYAATVFNKTVTGHCSAHLTDSGNGQRLWIVSGHWRSTAAITRITIYPVNGQWLTGSRFTIYGLG